MLPIFDLFWTLLAFSLALVPLVFIHELGHFLVARACGVHVEAFSIGFGRELFGWTDRYGTRWKVCPILLGGYVMMLGDKDPSGMTAAPIEEKMRSRTLEGQSPLRRIAIAGAGPFANYLLAFLMFFFLMVNVGVQNYPSEIGGVVSGGLAEKKGLQPGCIIQKMQQKSVDSFEDIFSICGQVPLSEDLALEVQFPDKKQASLVFPGQKDKKEGNWRGQLGITAPAEKVYYRQLSPSDAGKKVLEIINPMRNFSNLSLKNMGGPIALAQESGKALQGGLIRMMYFMASVSLALGFFNLIPLPMLDGGIIFLSLIEMVIRRPIPHQWKERLFQGSLFLLLFLFVKLSLNDVGKISFIKEKINNLTSYFIGP